MKKLFTGTSLFLFGAFGLLFVLAFAGILPDVNLFGNTSPLVPNARSDTNHIKADTHPQIPPTSAPQYPVENFTGGIAYKVVRVIDGDTVKVNYRGELTSIRFIGVDTPETVHPTKPVEFYGKEASNFTKNLLLGESVYLRFDTQKRDAYGRLLAYLYRAPDGLFVNLEIVRQGYGHVNLRFPFKYMALFRFYGNQARAVGKGLYGTPQSSKNQVTSPAGEVSAVTSRSDSETQVYVTHTGKKYHREECISLRHSKIPISLSEARERYEPCRKCRPPQ